MKRLALDCGILAAMEECLLAAMALKLKRMVNAVFFLCYIAKFRKKTKVFFLNFIFVANLTLPTI